MSLRSFLNFDGNPGITKMIIVTSLIVLTTSWIRHILELDRQTKDALFPKEL